MNEVGSKDFVSQELKALHQSIDGCTICLIFSPRTSKPIGIDRGTLSEVMVVGEAPGQKELLLLRSFSGQSGKKLFQWLVQAGLGSDEEEIRRRVYITSIIKCTCPDPLLYKRMVGNCLHYLQRQVILLKPRVIITLGKRSLEVISGGSVIMSDLIGRVFKEPDINRTLFPTLNTDATIIPFPHPSPANIGYHLKYKNEIEAA
ncbi:MAG: hypothetical protein L0Y74_01045, partial [candidate division Zixibacteria bacterium]|nr:hypothetical protein [candidate division Zixibacteria bacterium]